MPGRSSDLVFRADEVFANSEPIAHHHFRKFYEENLRYEGSKLCVASSEVPDRAIGNAGGPKNERELCKIVRDKLWSALKNAGSLNGPKNDRELDMRYARANNLQEMDVNSTAGEILQKSNDLFQSAQKPLVVLKLYYVSR